jgi:hypothetical protein
MTTKNKESNTTVPRDEAAESTTVPGEESDAAGRGSDPETTVPRDVSSGTTVPRDGD